MTHLDRITDAIDWDPGLDPIGLARCWPRDEPLAMLHSGRRDGCSGDWSRWSALARPHGQLQLGPGDPCWRGPAWPALMEVLAGCRGGDVLDQLDAVLELTTTPKEDRSPVPLATGGWLLSLAYELGELIEPGTMPNHGPGGDPLIRLLWCPDVLMYDHDRARWWSSPKAFRPEGGPDQPTTRRLSVSDWQSHPDRATFESTTAQTIARIRRGDLFQANIARHLRADAAGDLRRWAIDALDVSGAWFGCWMEWAAADRSHGLLSLSPELFLDVDQTTGRIRTRPIKGTSPAQADADDLAASGKDAAELNMIVDLMRNDLARVCRVGSVVVSQPRRIESHPTVHHGVAEVSGHLKGAIGLGELLRATFPPGSVTGAPKIKAMQLIDELESSPRGPYCGASGYCGRSGDLRLSVNIRTLAFDGHADTGFAEVRGRLDYGTGCGIVADSIPAMEFIESEHKAEALRRLDTAGVSTSHS